jgi:hypothetical protein
MDSNHEVTQVFGESCFHVAHEQAIQKAMNNN